MKKSFLVVCLMLLVSELMYAQATSDSKYLEKIDSLEAKIEQIKSLPKEEQKQYLTALSDVENRKNTLKTLLKTPPEKRDKTWEETWTKNYAKASEKLRSIKLK